MTTPITSAENWRGQLRIVCTASPLFGLTLFGAGGRLGWARPQVVVLDDHANDAPVLNQRREAAIPAPLDLVEKLADRANGIARGEALGSNSSQHPPVVTGRHLDGPVDEPPAVEPHQVVGRLIRASIA